MTMISDVLSKAGEKLRSNGIPDDRKEARSLLSFVLKRDTAFIIANPKHKLTNRQLEVFRAFVKRRSAREPFQHISGSQEFWGLDFLVSPDVLIPRPETEMIVEEAINLLSKTQNAEFCEVGIGSGCIAVSILSEIETARAIGVDISAKALAVAKENAEKHDVLPRLTLQLSDVFERLTDRKFHLIVSNPPYVSLDKILGLQAEVRDFDPPEALAGGKDGLRIIKRIVDESPTYLSSGGILLMEIGFDQSKKVRDIFDRDIWKSVEILPDLQGIPRMVKAKLVNN